MDVLYVVVPCYNEAEVLPITSKEFEMELAAMIAEGKISDDSRILFVNDGSSDDTWKIICDLAKKSKYFLGISQSRNRGHQNAVLAGLMEARNKCDITISIDCDGQDDIHAMSNMVDEYLNGYDVVYGVRSKRDSDTFFKKFTAEAFYKILRMFGADVVFNHADYRLVSSEVLDAFSNFKEVNLFLRGMFLLVGFKSTAVYYERNERVAGKSHYPLKKMLALAWDGITSLSTKPLLFPFVFGFILCLVGLIGFVVSLINGRDLVVDWPLFVMLWLVFFCMGVQSIMFGIIGQYVGKTYMEAKARPRYIISDRVGDAFDK
jgi:glycosyltransferase involved in cell wall biosynthesis